MNREERLAFLINRLKDESTGYAHLPIPDNIKEKQKLLRALMNVRPPQPIADEWLTLQDEELQVQLAEATLIRMNDSWPHVAGEISGRTISFAEDMSLIIGKLR